MASFSLFGSSTTARVLAHNDAGFIGQSATLATSGDAITASASGSYFSVDVTVLGGLFSDYGNAIDFDGNTLDLFVGTNGSVGSAGLDGVNASIITSAYISNDGYMYSGDDAMDLRHSDGSATIRIINTGTISGQSDAIVAGSGISTTYITNYGKITGGSGGIDQLSGNSVIINHGSISGQAYGYDGTALVNTVKNFGTIDGGVIVRDGDDIVTNRGIIDFVTLGAGADVFDGRGGIITEDVTGGKGDDVYIISQSDIVLKELASTEFVDQGIDLVKSKVNFTLSDNIENLTLIGNNNIRGTGNELNNVVIGNGEDNVLRGLSGADRLNGGGGNDVLRGGQSADKLVGGSGDDVLRGGMGSDELIGGAGDDILIGGAGKDKLSGSSGNDLFVFNRVPQSPNSSDRDAILDFELGIDRIDLSNLVAGTFDFVGASGFSGTGAEVNAFLSGGNTVVRIDVDGDGAADMKIILSGVTGVQDGDFIL